MQQHERWAGFIMGAILVILSAGLWAPAVHAQAWPALRASSDESQVLAAFKKGPYGNMAKGRVARQTVVPGIYAIVDPAGKYAPLFTDAKITKMKNGGSGWLDVASGNPLPAAQVQALRRDMASRIDTGRAIPYQYGQGGKGAILVTAYDCPYCRKLEQELDASAVNAKVYVFPTSLQHNQPGPMALARDIWCSADAASAWKAAILRKEAPAKAASSCTKDARDTSWLMTLFDIKGVPARILPDGRVGMFKVGEL
ncbi:Thiol:disulfide interchange protein DsbC [plant metagenome]|uniref:Thiol:disulfide interchange protein DsbC n=1 Tax=plant metagenome TaxID=1297885 RepID=A0A484RN53_9ZZZZ